MEQWRRRVENEPDGFSCSYYDLHPVFDGEASVRIISSLIVAGLASSPVCPTNSARAEELQSRHIFIVEYHPGSAWKPGVPMNKQALGPHAAYWKRLASQGQAIGAGPFRDVDGGMAIISASTKDEARTIVASDPAVRGDVFTATMHEWSPLIRGTGELPR